MCTHATPLHAARRLWVPQCTVAGCTSCLTLNPGALVPSSLLLSPICKGDRQQSGREVGIPRAKLYGGQGPTFMHAPPPSPAPAPAAAAAAPLGSLAFFFLTASGLGSEGPYAAHDRELIISEHVASQIIDCCEETRGDSHTPHTSHPTPHTPQRLHSAHTHKTRTLRLCFFLGGTTAPPAGAPAPVAAATSGAITDAATPLRAFLAALSSLSVPALRSAEGSPSLCASTWGACRGGRGRRQGARACVGTESQAMGSWTQRPAAGSRQAVEVDGLPKTQSSTRE